MVSSILFFRLNHRIIDIFGSDSDKAFAGQPVIVCDYFNQLPPVHGAPFYSANATMKGFVTFQPCQLFEMAGISQLTEAMCQRADLNSIGILNKIRTGDVNYSSRSCIYMRRMHQLIFTTNQYLLL